MITPAAHSTWSETKGPSSRALPRRMLASMHHVYTAAARVSKRIRLCLNFGLSIFRWIGCIAIRLAIDNRRQHVRGARLVHAIDVSILTAARTPATYSYTDSKPHIAGRKTVTYLQLHRPSHLLPLQMSHSGALTGGTPPRPTCLLQRLRQLR